MRVKAAMSSPVVAVQPDTPLAEAIVVMGGGGFSGLAVVDELGRLCGILSEGDMLRRVETATAINDDHWWSRLFASRTAADAYNHASGRRVWDVMNSPAITIDGDDSLADAARLMERHDIKRLPVISDGHLVGILSRSDFIDVLRRYLAPICEKTAASDRELRTRILAQIASQSWSAKCRIEVSVNDGRVSLFGAVPTTDHQTSARIAAENVMGALNVDEHIAVGEAMPPIAI